MDGSFSKVPSCNFDEDEVTTIGKIITHAFILYGVFPIQLCKASLLKYLCGTVDDDILTRSFLEYLPPQEEELLSNFSESTDSQAVIDIFSEFGILNLPTVENLPELIKKAAKMALIKQPCFNLQALVQGMGKFWNSVTGDMLQSLYVTTIPTAKKIVECVESNEKGPQDQKVTTWLHRYIRSCTSDQLVKFVRFVSGSPSLTPNSKIRIEFVNQAVTSLYPTSKACFKILYIPRQYCSFYQLKDNLDIYINQSNSSYWSMHDNLDFDI